VSAACRVRRRRTLRIPADLAALAPVRDLLAGALERRGWSREDVWRVLLVAQEALVNAVEHGSTSGALVEVRFAVGRTRARIRIRDAGRPGATSPSGPAVTPPAGQAHGRGRLIMEALADASRSRPSGAGTEVSLLVLNRPTPSPATGPGPRPDARPIRSAVPTMVPSGPRG
jgi:anti-sigma regulatory factor (Ser/Thr protein kinase)